MKKFLLMLVAILTLVGTSGCSDSNFLSAGSAKSGVKKSPMFSEDGDLRLFNTGYYEVPEQELGRLKELQKAGMIKLAVEEIKEQTRKMEYSYWEGYTSRTVEVVHFFANVELTPEGQKYVVENAENYAVGKNLAKYLDKNIGYEEVIPDYITPEAEEVVETTTEVVAPVEEAAPAVEEVAEATEMVATEEAVPTMVADTNPDNGSPYQVALQKVEKTEVYVKCGRYKVEKVLDILCTPKMAEEGTGSGTVVFTYAEKTPFGWVYGAPSENYYYVGKGIFTHYQDEGWVLTNLDFDADQGVEAE